MQYEMSLCADAPVGELRLGPARPSPNTSCRRFCQIYDALSGRSVAMMSGNSDQVEQALGGHGIDLEWSRA
ncbi:MAG: hypothetical protein ACLRMJ_02805 [Alistipes finegoldii]